MKLLILFAIVTNFQICWFWVDPDCFDKYLNPKEAFIGNGCLNNEFVKVANGNKK